MKQASYVGSLKQVLIKMKQASYVPHHICVLYDVYEKQKKKMLLGHSEKLALTFPTGEAWHVM